MHLLKYNPWKISTAPTPKHSIGRLFSSTNQCFFRLHLSSSRSPSGPFRSPSTSAVVHVRVNAIVSGGAEDEGGGVGFAEPESFARHTAHARPAARARPFLGGLLRRCFKHSRVPVLCGGLLRRLHENIVNLDTCHCSKAPCHCVYVLLRSLAPSHARRIWGSNRDGTC